ncbi:MAG: 4-hydroxybenzoate octaprenyltransferase [Betaproteobacteria bacterium]|nr:4-hydroxybenzoate octaprenyltransferase [Betaproteobacteria bacterium]
MTLTQRLREYSLLVRLHKPIGILLLLWPTLWGLWIASDGVPSWTLLFVFVMGTVLMRSAGCAINDYADRDFDGAVKRTADRPLASGRIQPKEAVWVAIVLAALAFAMTVALTNTLTVQLSVIAAFLAASYPFTKRFFAMPQAYLGIAFGFGIPMAFAAVQNAVPPVAWALLVANVFWTLAYDTEYAMVDRDDDVKIGIKTTALLFGKYDVLAVVICYAISLAILVQIGSHLGLGWPYFCGIGIAISMVLSHYQWIRGRSREGCFKAFLHNNWVGGAIFAGLVADYALR